MSRRISLALRHGLLLTLIGLTACAPMTVQIGALPVATIGAESTPARPMPEVDRVQLASASHSNAPVLGLRRRRNWMFAFLIVAGISITGLLIWAVAS